MNIPFTDKEKLGDAISSQKQITSDYNTFANESATPEVVSKDPQTHLIYHPVKASGSSSSLGRPYPGV